MPELIPAEPLTPEWHAARREGVTATDIVTILGLSSWDSPYSLFWRKMGQVPDQPDNDRMRLGRALESYVFICWAEDHFNDGQNGSAQGSRLYRSSARPWQMATPDYVLSLGAGPHAVLELKTWADADRHAWDTGPPPRVRAQVLWQMDVMDVAVGHVGVVFLPSGEFRSYEIQHPLAADLCSVCQDIGLMRSAGEEFMARLRLELPPPDPDASAATLAAQRARFTRQPGKTAEVDLGLWNAWYGAKSEVDRWAEIAHGHESKLREQAGEASILTVDGQPVARRIISDAQVKAHVRHQDYLKRIKQEGDDDE